MRFRPPSVDSFSIAVSLWVGWCVYVVIPAVGFTSNGVGLAVLATGVNWILLEQIPERVDSAVDRRLYLPLGGVALVSLLGYIVDDVLRTSVVPESVHSR